MSDKSPKESIEKDEKTTPRWLFDQLNAEFHFTRDAAATEENHLCERYYTKSHSAFDHEWVGGPVWLNPPYSAGQIKHWTKRVIEQVAKHGIVVVMLVPTDPTTKWWRLMWANASEVRFVGKRIGFNGEVGAKFSNAIAIFGTPRQPVVRMM